MTLVERADEWLHSHAAGWLARFLGFCWLVDRRLDAMERRG
jgi:hypothetical protein